MGAFEFNALDVNGRQRKGVLEGDTARQIRQQLREKGWVPLGVEEVKRKSGDRQQSTLFVRGISAKDLALLTRQLATLVSSGTPVEESVSAVARQTAKPRIKSTLLAVRAKVMEGHSLAAALADFPASFPKLYQATVASGEQAGHLSQVLERLADYTERRQEVTQNVVSALVYPILLFFVSIGIVVLMLTVVVPQMLPVFESSRVPLPLVTRILIGLSEILQEYWLPIIGVLALAMFMASVVLKRPGPKRKAHGFLLKLPIAGPLIRSMNASRFARTFSILSGAGVPVLEGLRISGQVIGNLPMQSAIEEVTRKVREGAGISRSLEDTHMFPPMMVHLIGSGESSGKLEQMLEKSAESQERELEATLNAMVSLLGPLVILAMGGLVMFIMGAILMPIMQMNQMLQ